MLWQVYSCDCLGSSYIKNVFWLKVRKTHFSKYQLIQKFISPKRTCFGDKMNRPSNRQEKALSDVLIHLQVHVLQEGRTIMMRLFNIQETHQVYCHNSVYRTEREIRLIISSYYLPDIIFEFCVLKIIPYNE